MLGLCCRMYLGLYLMMYLGLYFGRWDYVAGCTWVCISVTDGTMVGLYVA